MLGPSFRRTSRSHSSCWRRLVRTRLTPTIPTDLNILPSLLSSRARHVIRVAQGPTALRVGVFPRNAAAIAKA